MSVPFIVVYRECSFSQRVRLWEIEVDVVAVFGGKNQSQNSHFPRWCKPILLNDVHERVWFQLDD